jgi:replicative DNA helicase
VSDVPCDLAAEAAVLGAMLLDAAAVPEACEHVTAADFWRGSHRTVFEAVTSLHQSGADVDAVTVADELGRRGQLDAVGHTLPTDLLAACPTAATVGLYARIVADRAARRRTIDAARALASAAGDMTVDVDAAVSDATERLAAGRGAGPVVQAGLGDAALGLVDGDPQPYGWPAPWPPLATAWRIVPGWVHVVIGWPSHGKSAVCDALVVGLAADHGVASLVWSPEGAPSARHLLRMATIRAGVTLTSPAAAVESVAWVEQHVAWVDHDRRTTLPRVLAAADAHAARHRLDVVVVDPFTSLDKWDADAGEPWDRMLNRHLTRLQRWARARRVAVVVVAHPKQRDRFASGLQPVCTSSDIAGGAMWANQIDSLVSVWRDSQGVSRPKERVDVHVQKVRDDGLGGQMGRCGELVRLASGRYAPLSRLREVV